MPFELVHGYINEEQLEDRSFTWCKFISKCFYYKSDVFNMQLILSNNLNRLNMMWLSTHGYGLKWVQTQGHGTSQASSRLRKYMTAYDWRLSFQNTEVCSNPKIEALTFLNGFDDWENYDNQLRDQTLSRMKSN